IDGANSRFFYAAGAIHPSLRTALLPRELLHLRGGTVRVAVHRALTPRRESAALAVAQPAASVERELTRVPRSRELIATGAFHVFCAAAQDIPVTLEEIGRLREITFREVGEGTGRTRDLDRFDQHYLHLVAWDATARRVAGAYRIGRADRIMAEH